MPNPSSLLGPRRPGPAGPASPASGPLRRAATQRHTKEAAAITPSEGHPLRRPPPTFQGRVPPPARTRAHTTTPPGLPDGHPGRARIEGQSPRDRVPIRAPPRRVPPTPHPWVTISQARACASPRERAHPLPRRPPAHAHTKAAIVLGPGTIPRAKPGPRAERQPQPALLPPPRPSIAPGRRPSPARGTQEMETKGAR